ncbi:MAG: hypothetical protein GC178_09980 [Flavobacteriales bacterium]|nr:hypothetical protein [Flavobacteriales bacterium]
MKNRKIILTRTLVTAVLLISPYLGYGQLFDLKANIFFEFSNKTTCSFYISHSENRGRMPYYISSELIKMFDLRDTIINGIQINLFQGRELARAYGLNRTGNTLSTRSVMVKSSAPNEIVFVMRDVAFPLDKNFFKKGRSSIGALNRIWTIRYFLKEDCTWDSEVILER